MAFNLVQDDGVVRVTCSGVVTVPERTRALSVAFAATPLTRKRRVLVDFRAASATPPAMDFEESRRFVDLLSRETQGGLARIAYLTGFELHIDRCIEMLVEFKRLPIRRFTDEEAALDWLHGD